MQLKRMEKKDNRGGRRPGAGRKSVANKRVQVCVSVTQETKEKMAFLREKGIRIGRFVDELVEGLIEEGLQ